MDTKIDKIPCINCITLARCKALAKDHIDRTIHEENFDVEYIFFMNVLEYEVCSVLKHYINDNKRKDAYQRLLVRADKIKAVYKYIIKGIK